jgi:hypothetical protein
MGEDEKGNPGDPDMGNREDVKPAPGKPDTTEIKPAGGGGEPEKGKG